MGPVHAGMVQLLRRAPKLLVELLIHAKVLPDEVLEWKRHVLPTEAVVTRPKRRRRELRSDIVLLVAAPEVDVENAEARKEALANERAFAVIFEFQRVRDESRADAWSDYWTAYRLDLGPKMRLVIMTFEPAVARWANRRTDRLRRLLHVCVVTPSDLPRWVAVDGKREPERAVLSAMLHGRSEDGSEFIREALRALEGLDEQLAVIYEEMLLEHLDDKLVIESSDTKESAMNEISEVDRRDVEKSPRPLLQIAAAWNRQQGRKEGLEEGLQQGLQQGQLEARAKMIVEILTLRGVPIHPDLRAQILECRQSDTLDAAFAAALRVSDASELPSLEG